MRPNILLITADHMRHDAIACNADNRRPQATGHTTRTPNLDSLAGTGAGVTFVNSYTPNPICVPARASITTGNYPHLCTGSKNNGGRILPGQPKLAEHFAAHGYATYAIGKLHYVPYSPPGTDRLLHGFETVELNEEGRIIREFDPLGEQRGLEDYHDWLKGQGWGGYERAHGIGNNDVHPCPSPLPAEYHEEAWVCRRAVHHLGSHRDRRPESPFLMWASFSKPHSPYDPPRPYDALYDPRAVPPPLGDWEDDSLLAGRDLELARRRAIYGWDTLSREAVQTIRAAYSGMVTFQDEMVGRILGALDQYGLAENTIVVYTADHGDMLGDFGRFFKTCMYDGATRVPLIVRAPGVIRGGGVHQRDQLAGLQDLLPTLASLTACPLERPVQGKDLTPILRDPTAPGRSAFVAETMESPVQKHMVRTPQWKYVHCELGGTEELYDMNAVNAEMVNLAEPPEHASVLASLRQHLIDWCVRNGDSHALGPDGCLLRGDSTAGQETGFRAGAMGWRRY